MVLQNSLAGQESAMATSDAHSTLITVWNAQRAFVVELGRALHAVLPSTERRIMLHGRDLKPETEGVGGQLQYRLDDELDGPGHACFVIDIALKRGRTSLVWEINAVSIESRDADYTIAARETFTLPVMRRTRLRELFANDLTRIASEFLCRDQSLATASRS
jgi:hypothetical protein